ncbi:potassium transporter TrkG [Saccharopolyspora sp. TS4A08]|uniref:Potassium transporter TrkG n=1 Tax=Saccharopolyspora ipomoeae TaxID=3042027 RepID=A0ABT6PIP1_9PSEU|nr:potassium transporter TrkG [Saccharopolyspora sp. TS4A08]MDI2027341.1 potassium transporter TrkG [Saccharopolyspora sp. TS4A08]
MSASAFERGFAAAARRPSVPIVLGFAALIAVGTVLLMMPFSTESGEPTALLPALFTATSAVCVTGLIVVDTPTYFSTAGELIILGLIQLGGLGIMTVASLLSLLMFRRFGLRMRLTAQAETKSLGLGDVRRMVTRVIGLSLLFELVVAVLLTGRLLVGYREPLGRAIYDGVFHAISAFNNAGFALRSDNLISFATDPWFILPICFAVIAGGLGFPVWVEILRHLRSSRRWTMHARVTLLATALLLVVGAVGTTLAEWSNPGTLGPMSWPAKLLAGFSTGVMPRTAGFNSLDVAAFHPGTLLLQDILMFIGGGSAGTAGGIKVTTFALLAFVILAEIRGEPTVHVMGRRLPELVQRQALTIVLLGVAVVMLTVLVLLAISPFGLDQVLFEAISAFATVGLSTGITAQLPAFGQILLVLLMFIGRLGPITLASALALRERARRYELPEERPIVG